MKWATLIVGLILAPILAIAAYDCVEEMVARRGEAKQELAILAEMERANQALRQAVLRYTHDKGRAPQSLDELIDAGYLKTQSDDLTRAGYYQGMPRRSFYFDPPIPPRPAKAAASVPAS